VVDPRIERLAELIAGYSLGLGPGDVVRIDAPAAAEAHVAALTSAALRRGAHPYSSVALDGLAEILYREGSDEQLAFTTDAEREEWERIDAFVVLWAESNTRTHTRADPERQRLHLSSRRELRKIFRQRTAAGSARWCGTLAPTQAHAQDAEMSLEEYEDFVYGALHVLDGEDTVAYWQARSAELTARAAELDRVRELRIVGDGTDLRVEVGGRRWIVADGHRNLPDGEVYTSPLETGTEGEIRFAFPAIFDGREVEDVRLRFEGGRVVEAEAARGGDYLQTVLDLEGARVLGEVAFGLNYEIGRFTRNILLDEKIGGTMHVALGSSFPLAGGENQSTVHWDLICDLRADGEVYADGDLVWQAGRFLAEPALARV
jgi:aminopeptidase